MSDTQPVVLMSRQERTFGRREGIAIRDRQQTHFTMDLAELGSLLHIRVRFRLMHLDLPSSLSTFMASPRRGQPTC